MAHVIPKKKFPNHHCTWKEYQDPRHTDLSVATVPWSLFHLVTHLTSDNNLRSKTFDHFHTDRGPKSPHQNHFPNNDHNLNINMNQDSLK
jgi:hypothetical protein